MQADRAHAHLSKSNRRAKATPEARRTRAKLPSRRVVWRRAETRRRLRPKFGSPACGAPPFTMGGDIQAPLRADQLFAAFSARALRPATKPAKAVSRSGSDLPMSASMGPLKT